MNWFLQRRMGANVTEGWQEYPVECWGLGSYSANNNGSYVNASDLLYWMFPLQSTRLYIENNSTNYSTGCYFYNDNGIGINSGEPTGESTAPSGASLFGVKIYSTPPFSVVDSGLVKIYYWGQPYQKPTPKPVMTGADYLWSMGGMTRGQIVLSNMKNKCTRNLQPLVSGIMDVDATQLTAYTLNVSLHDSNGNWIKTKNYKGNSGSNILSDTPTAAYYKLAMWDTVPMTYAMNAPFVITFR